MLPALLALLAAATPRPFEEERLLLDRRLETLRRILPDGPNPVGDAALVKELAEGAHLQSVEALARPPADSSAPYATVIVDFSALGRYADVDRFVRQVALSHRLVDVESLTLDATNEGIVKVTAALHLPYRPVKAPLPAAPEGARAAARSVSRQQSDAFVRDMALALAKSDAVASLRRSRRNPRLFLSELAAVVRDRPVVLTFASVSDEFVVRGLTVGEGPVRALESRFERGFFRVSDFLMVRQGACLRFEARGACPVVGPDAELPLPAEDPFVQDESPCRVDRDSVRTVVVTGPSRKGPGQGPISLRLRDVDLTDVFYVLHTVTGQGFLVDGDVAGRVSVEMSRVTLEEALDLVARKARLRVSGTGLVRRISLASTSDSPASRPAPAKDAPAAPPDAGGPPSTFTLKRADVRDVLAVMSEVDPSLAALGPPGFLGRVSLWVRDAPLGILRSAVLESAGLQERLEEERRILERRAGEGENAVPVAGSDSESRLVMGAQDMTVLDFQLSGLASSDDAWIAFAYAPTGTLHPYRAGDRLADAQVRRIESTDLTLDTDEGPLGVGLSPLP
ncbi:MAG TPA: hypothetical protein VIC87_16320, partial [Vicinamibacteria bacterium]